MGARVKELESLRELLLAMLEFVEVYGCTASADADVLCFCVDSNLLLLR